MEIWLPESWEGADPNGPEMGAMIEFLKTMGPDFEQAARTVEQNPSAFALWVVDSEIGDSGLLTNPVIGREQSTMAPNEYLDRLIEQFSTEIGRVVDRKIMQLDRYQAGQMILELFDESGETGGKEAFYVVKAGDALWILNFFTGIEEFDQRLPVFEQSIRTFVVQP